ncbi:NADPH-dependent FMN reductase [Phyllobacterium sophorae]|uniref:NADPH-dependent FMN reductase n=1 Tax=Phyllobacterium sophorae TaxID=1520277 RepID=A0A2P7B701_9HYPH|nr:NADPH-dependent FMN reductase [Phyllobacterium sophorae]PSH62241.1 NADPH-dependent FMN reductase [Phyllobacterium sophorae]
MTDRREINAIGLCGSLRRGSYNMLALRAAQKLAPHGMTVSIESIAEIPLYNEDLRTTDTPDAVVILKNKIAAADAILLVSPEYNYSIPGVLKNALDWLSRPPEPPFNGKPVAIMGASIGHLGTARGQYHLRQVLVYMNTFTLNKPEVFIGQADRKFDANGHLIDETTIRHIAEQLKSLDQLVRRLNPERFALSLNH